MNKRQRKKRAKQCLRSPTWMGREVQKPFELQPYQRNMMAALHEAATDKVIFIRTGSALGKSTLLLDNVKPHCYTVPVEDDYNH